MSEETKQPTPEEVEEAQAGSAPAEETVLEETAEKTEKKAKKKKEKGYTFTREQVEQMELAVKQLESTKDQFARLAAEYDNYRKRTAKEKETLYQDAKADTIKEFLAVYGNLERAAAAPGGEDDPHKKGLEMIFTQYKELLKKLGVSEIEAQGRPFDPERHEAVMHVDDEGHLIPLEKVRGRKKSLRALVDHMAETANAPVDAQTVFITHGDCLEDAEYVAELVHERFGVTDIMINWVDPVIGAHSGPGTMALFFLASER